MTVNDPHQPGVPEGLSERDVDQRAELASYLGKEVWPATAAQLQDVAASNGAPDAVRGRLSRLPADRAFRTVGDVWEALTGHKEQHRF